MNTHASQTDEDMTPEPANQEPANQEPAGTPESAPEDTRPSNAAQSDYWVLKYGEDLYGPYTIEAMERYIKEGRVAAQSIIAPAGSENWQSARDVSIFAAYFDRGRADQSHATAAAARNERPAYGSGKGQVDRRKRADTNNFVVITQIKSHHGPDLERAIMSVGPAMKIAPNAWVINAKTTAPGLLNHLSQHIGRIDQLFVSDATADRIAWFNFGPELDAKVRRVWRKPVS